MSYFIAFVHRLTFKTGVLSLIMCFRMRLLIYFLFDKELVYPIMCS